MTNRRRKRAAKPATRKQLNELLMLALRFPRFRRDFLKSPKKVAREKYGIVLSDSQEKVLRRHRDGVRKFALMREELRKYCKPLKILL